jgi:hypothetical protein
MLDLVLVIEIDRRRVGDRQGMLGGRVLVWPSAQEL